MSFRNVRFIVLALLVTSVPAAALMVDIPMDQMAGTATAIVQGRTVDLNSYWLDGQNSIIVTDVSFVVDQSWLGIFNPGEQLVVRVVGGKVGLMGMRQEHQPEFTPGEEAVLFLWTRPDNGQLAIYQDEQGKYTVIGDTVTGYTGRSIEMVDFREMVQRAIQRR